MANLIKAIMLEAWWTLHSKNHHSQRADATRCEACSRPYAIAR